MLSMFSVDWCQYSCIYNGRADSFLALGQIVQGRRPCGDSPFPKYVVSEGVEYNRQYKVSFCLKWRGFAVAHVFCDPRRADQRRERCIFKASNRLLYMSGWADVFLDIIHACGCYVVSLSRLDICCDFNSFASGLHPKEFIRRYLVPPIGVTPSYIRHSSNKFRAFGHKLLHDEGTTASADFQTLSFGTRDSAVQTNLYNKSAELREHDKPYIRAAWIAAGLNPADVWRVEFSLNSRGVCVVPALSDYIVELAPHRLQLQDYLSSVFLSFAKSYFSFHEYFAGETRKLRSLPFANLFERPESPVVKPISFNRSKATGRTERIVEKKLRSLVREGDFSPAELRSWGQVITYVQELAQQRKICASMEEGDTILLADLAGRIMADAQRTTDGVGRVRKERISRLVTLLLSSNAEDVQAYKEAFVDFLWHAGVFAPESYLEPSERMYANPEVIAPALSPFRSTPAEGMAASS